MIKAVRVAGHKLYKCQHECPDHLSLLLKSVTMSVLSCESYGAVPPYLQPCWCVHKGTFE